MKMFKNDILEILSTSCFYPSGDNCQPFRFQVHADEMELEIYHVDLIAMHSLNYKNIASLISFGALLENIRISAKYFGYIITEKLFVEQAIGDFKLLGIIKFDILENKDEEPLYKAIRERFTDRRRFKRRKIDEKELIVEHKFKNCNFKIISAEDSFLNRALATSDSLLWNWKQAAYDILDWVRFSEKDKDEEKTGFSWQNLGVDYPTSRILKLMKKYPIVYKCMILFGFSLIVRLITFINIKFSSKLLLVHVSDQSNETLIDAGRLMQRMWLNLTKHKYSAQPIMSLMLTSYTKNRYEDRDYPLEIEKNIKKGKELLKKYLKEEEIPLIILRVGYAGEFPEKMRTLRKDVEDVII